MGRVSDDGEEGFPGRLEVTVTFRLKGNELSIDYQARSDRRTVVNLTNHSYWNLAGAGAGRDAAMQHELEVFADSYLPVDDEFIPIGSLEPVRHSPFDFRTPRPIGDQLALSHRQLDRAGGIDHTFVLRPAATTLRRAARVTDPASGRSLSISSSEPGLQVYTGNMLDGSHSGHGSKPYSAQSGLAFEPQHFPDSPNRRGFPSANLAPGAVLRSTTTYSFGREENAQ
jgi:aldose 1-epimerase